MKEQTTWTASPYQGEPLHPTRKQQQHPADISGYDDRVPTRRPTSTRRYTTNGTPRTIFRVVEHTEPQRIQRASLYGAPGVTQEPAGQAALARTRRVRLHWLATMGIGMLTMLAAWLILANVLTWWQSTQEDWQYGRPRTAQYDVNVGHGGISHFIAVNLHGHILVTEFQTSDPTKSKLYVGPTLLGAGSELAPVMPSFRDINGDGQPDLLIQVYHNTYPFINDHGSFRLPRQGERLSL